MKVSRRLVFALVCLATSALAQTGSQNAIPTINQLLPASLRPSQGVTLTILGANFSQGATVQISSIPAGITVQSASATVNSTGTQIVASFPFSNAFSAAGTLAVTVINGPGLASNVAYLSLTYPTNLVGFPGNSGASLFSGTAGIAVADFNGDGVLDIAATNSTSNLVQILLGNGNATYTNNGFVSVGNSPGGIVAGDFNGDGKSDLAVANATGNSIQILLGNGDGTFVSGPPIPVGGVLPTALVAADFNRDGKLDLAVIDYCGTGTTGCAPTGAPLGPAFLTIFLGNGDGTFVTSPASPATGVQPAAIVAGDWNADGFIDLAVVNTGSNSVTVLMGNGDGTFSPTMNSPATGSRPHDLAIADFNGDGALDLAIPNEGDNTVTLLLNQGCSQGPAASCSFSAVQPGVFVGSRPQAIATADMNGDGFPDLVTANFGDNSINVLLNDGTGNFSSSFPHNWSFPVTTNPFKLVLGDFNDDGRTDVLVNGISGNSLLVASPVEGITISADNGGTSQFGQQVTFTAQLLPPLGHPAANGVVTFTDGTTILGTASTNSDAASFQTNSLAVGVHQIVASYNGDAFYPPTTSSAVTQVVQQAATTTALTSSTNPSIWGQAVILTAAVSGGTASGTVTFTDTTTSTTLGTASIANNQGQISASNLTPGAHAITASYSGDSNLLASTSSALTQTVNQASTTITIGSNTNPSAFGQSVVLSASVQPAFGGTATGTITFLDAGVTLGTAAASSNSAQLSVSSLSVGTHSLTARYGGDANLLASTSSALTQMVNQASTTITVGSNTNPSAFGQSVVLSASVQPAFGGTATGAITFLDAGVTLGTAAVSSNSAQLSVSSLSVGTHSLTARYGGDANLLASTSTSLQQVVNPAATTIVMSSNPNPSSLGQTVTLSATVSSSTSSSPTGSVTWSDGSTALGSASLSANGFAQLAISTLTVGSHSISAAYSGDFSFTASTSGALTQTVTRASTSTGLASSLNPAGYSQTITFTATVQNSIGGTATGSVSFVDNGVQLGSVALSGNIARLTTSSLNAGSHSILAVYGGDANFAGSTSGSLSQTVNAAATSTSLVSSLNPAKAGQTVTFTASVSSSVAGTQTGTVSFYVDGNATPAGSAALSGGTAQFSTSTLAGGAHTITASFASSNANFLGSSSAPLTQTVSDFALSVSPSSLTVTRPHGGAYTLTINSVSGFAGAVSVSCGGAPANTTCSVTPSQVSLNSNSAQVSVKITTAKSAAPGTYTLNLTASSSSISHTAAAQLILN